MAQRELEVAAALPPGNVLTVLNNQHARIRELFEFVLGADGPARQVGFDDLRELPAIHEAGEEVVVRPVIRPFAGFQVIDAATPRSSEAAYLLAELEKQDVNSAEFTLMITEREKAVSDHAEQEELEQFPRILAQVSAQDQQKMSERLLTAEKIARHTPTRQQRAHRSLRRRLARSRRCSTRRGMPCPRTPQVGTSYAFEHGAARHLGSAPRRQPRPSVVDRVAAKSVGGKATDRSFEGLWRQVCTTRS